MKWLVILVVVIVLFGSMGMVGAQEEEVTPAVVCQLTLEDQVVNRLVIRANFTGADWATLEWVGGATDLQDGDTADINLSFDAGPNQSVRLLVNEVECFSLPVGVSDWLPPDEGNTGTSGGSPVGNHAFVGSGIDDCRFFIPSSFWAKYDLKKNEVNIGLRKMGENSRPFAVQILPTNGVIPWNGVRDDPFLGGDGGLGGVTFNLPYDEVLVDKTITTIDVLVTNNITGVECVKVSVPIR